MRRGAAILLAALALTAAVPRSDAGVVVGVGIGVPVYRPYCYRPYWGYGYYRPYGVVVAPSLVVAPPPVVVGAPEVVAVPTVVAAPTVVQPAPVAAAPATAAPTTVRASGPEETVPPPSPLPVTAVAGSQDAVEQNLQLLANPDERTRSDAALQLGHMKAERAVDRLSAVLGNDRSPAVREAAARALGLIGSPRGMAALRQAGQADNDRDVRRSAQFALDVITTNLKH
jgi:hypothetical protein